jgi:uncharacterized protein YkwD
MRSLVLRGALVAALLLPAVLITRAAPAQQRIVAQSAAITTPIQTSDVSEIAPWRLSRPTPAPTPSPTAAAATHLPRIVALKPPATKKPPAAAPPPAAVPAPPAIAGSGAGQMSLINQDRASAGLPPLQWNACLANIAVGQAQRMAAQGYISHANGRILDLGCRLGNRASESIGVQYGHIDDGAMNAWFMGDPIHRDNIMGPYHYVGACWVWGANSRAYLAIEFA